MTKAPALPSGEPALYMEAPLWVHWPLFVVWCVPLASACERVHVRAVDQGGCTVGWLVCTWMPA